LHARGRYERRWVKRWTIVARPLLFVRPTLLANRTRTPPIGS
jgi:hypothetical protein